MILYLNTILMLRDEKDFKHTLLTIKKKGFYPFLLSFKQNDLDPR